MGLEAHRPRWVSRKEGGGVGGLGARVSDGPDKGKCSEKALEEQVCGRPAVTGGPLERMAPSEQGSREDV